MEKWKTLQDAWKSKPFTRRFPLSHRLYDNDKKHQLPIKNVSTFNQDLTGTKRLTTESQRHDQSLLI
jgi:hypothetical protein